VSRLDSFIRRLEAQRACLARAAGLVGDLPGPILELGLGAGRTYDHLRGLLPERVVYVLEREVTVAPRHAPPAARLLVGDFREILAEPPAAIRDAALAHADIGTWDEVESRALAAALAPLLDTVLRDGAVVASDQPMHRAGWTALPLPQGVAPGRYFLYRVRG